MTQEFIIDGNNFDDFEGFMAEAQRIFTQNMEYPIRSMDSLNDILRGGFGRYDYGTKLVIKWINAGKSRLDLGYDATVLHYEKIMAKCHPSNVEHVKARLTKAQNQEGDTVFDMLVRILSDKEEDRTLIIED